MTGHRLGDRDKLGVPERLRRFFADNPFEELSVDDVAVKFGCQRGTAEHAVATLRQDGLVERVSVYRLTRAEAPRGSLPQSVAAQPARTATDAPLPCSEPAAAPPNSHPTEASASPACPPEPPTP